MRNRYAMIGRSSTVAIQEVYISLISALKGREVQIGGLLFPFSNTNTYPTSTVVVRVKNTMTNLFGPLLVGTVGVGWTSPTGSA